MVEVHPSAVVANDVTLGSDVKIGPNCVVGSGVSIGDSSVLDANVVIGRDVVIGKNNRFFPNGVIGGEPQVLGLSTDTKTGGLVIGDGNVLREQVTIHPSIYPDKDTKIGNDNLLMIGVHIGHDCVLEDKLVLSNYVQLAGHCKIETGVWFSAMVLLHQFITIGRWCYASGLAGINRDIPPFLVVSGHYPPTVRGVNKRGLLRAGLDEAQQQNIYDAYKKLYRSSGSLVNNALKLSKVDGLDENVKAMAESVIRSSIHRYVRYFETFRH